MSHVIVTSTTDSQAAVETAATAFDNDTLVGESQAESSSPAADSEGHVTPVITSDDGHAHVASTTDSQQAVNDTATDMREEKEFRSDEVMGRTRRKLVEQVKRLNEKLERYERGQLPSANAQPAPQNGNDQQQRPPQAEQQQQQQQTPLTREQAEAELARFEAEAVMKHHARQVADQYNRQVEVARAAHEDFDKVINTPAPLPYSAINAMYEMENGAEVAYYIAKHPEVRTELLELDRPGGQLKMAVKLNDISERLSGGRAVRQQATARPPAPIKPVGGASPSRSSVDADRLDYRDYKKWRNNGGGGR